jgi:hypothetical protein
VSETGTNRWIDKVQKLLNLAEDKGASPEEAEAFAAKAEELMIRHAIDAAMLQELGGKKTDVIVQKRIGFGGIFSTADRSLANRVGEAFGFKVLQSKAGPKHYAIWVGFESETRDAEILVASLLIQSRRALEPQATMWRARGCDKQELYVLRRSFIDAFGSAAAKRVAESRRQITAEVADKDNRLLPVLASREQLVQAEYEAMFPNVRPGRAVSRRYSYAGAVAGAEAGAKADINSKKLGVRKQLES